jgi:hypothetical protein
VVVSFHAEGSDSLKKGTIFLTGIVFISIEAVNDLGPVLTGNRRILADQFFTLFSLLSYLPFPSIKTGENLTCEISYL